ncbi:MAG: AAA family ATPase, partial [Leptonema sp. (in: Bacteria)]|nr:AAA family ATPase [Leptonema sp. (in: bacteria)]
QDLPGGIKQRLALSCSLIHDPKLIFLDEPTAGVDPASRRIFWDLIRDLKEQGRTIFVTTHYMDEVEQCDRIALMNRGRIDALDTPLSLRTKILPGPVFEVTGKEPAPIKQVLEAIQAEGEIVRFDPFGRGFHVVSTEAGLSNKTKQTLETLHCNVHKINASLEDVFVYVIGHEK